MEEKVYWLGFSMVPGIGPKRFQLLLDYFGSAEKAWNGSKEELIKSGIGPSFAAKLLAVRPNIDFEKYVKQLEESNVQFITLGQNEYPSSLKEIENPPFVLYVKGELVIPSDHIGVEESYSTNVAQVVGDPSTMLRSGRDDKIIAVVGTRKITQYGKDVTEQITERLVSAGFTIVSGLAFGVDACAHRTTIENSGKTIAVLGCGIDCCFPRENSGLYEEIINSGGAIVSEFPFSELPSKGSFPSRNRIIAGLSEAVVVTEGAEDSGALYTANDALKIGRPVFAVPGQITSSLSKGPLGLIKKGATLVTSVEDILKELGNTRITSITGITSKKEIKADNEEEQRIIDLLQNESLYFDEIVRRVGVDSAKIGVLLSMMEMKGMVKSSENGYYSL